MTDTQLVEQSTEVDALAAGALIAESFAELAVTHWLVPDDPAERVRILGAQFAMFVTHGLAYGEVHTIGDEAVAVWFDNTVEAPWIESYDERMAELAGDRLERFQRLDLALEEHHPHDRGPHFHLALLAVRPGAQGRGHGSALLARQLQRLDALGVPAYLEASSLQSRALYLRHGFDPLGEPYNLPEDGPQFYPLWRDPR